MNDQSERPTRRKNKHSGILKDHTDHATGPREKKKKVTFSDHNTFKFIQPVNDSVAMEISDEMSDDESDESGDTFIAQSLIGMLGSEIPKATANGIPEEFVEGILGQIPKNVATYAFDYPDLLITFPSYQFHYLQFTLDNNNILKMDFSRRIKKSYIAVGENHLLLTFEKIAQPVLDCPCKSLEDIPELVNKLADKLIIWKSTGILLYQLFEEYLGFVEWNKNRCSVHFIFVERVIGNFYFHIDYDVNDDIPALRYSLEHSKHHYIIDEVKDLFLKNYNKEENNIIACCNEIINVFRQKPLDIHAFKTRESGVTLELKI